MCPSSRQSEEPFQSDVDRPATPSLHKASPFNASPTAQTPEQATTRSSESSQEATEADRREARQLLSQQGAFRKTGWLLLRSTGPNLTNVLQNAGAKGLSVRQLYNFRFEREWLIHCFILLYKWSPDRGDRVRWNPERLAPMFTPAMEDDSGAASAEDIMFCNHTMDNASATQALIMSILNIPESGGRETEPFTYGETGVVQEFDIGHQLRLLKGFVKPMDPILRAAAVCSADVVRKAHNEAAKLQYGGHPELLDEDGKVRSTILSDELWMYSVYMPSRDHRHIFELESMTDEAKVVGVTNTEDGEEWARIAEYPIMQRISTFREHHTPFLLFAVTSEVKQAVLPRIPRKEKSNPDENPAESNHGSWNKEKEDGEIRDSDERDEARNEGVMSEEEEVDEEAVKEELRRTRAIHGYETFFVEMMKLMASRGDINAIIREDDAIHETTSEEDP